MAPEHPPPAAPGPAPVFEPPLQALGSGWEGDMDTDLLLREIRDVRRTEGHLSLGDFGANRRPGRTVNLTVQGGLHLQGGGFALSSESGPPASPPVLREGSSQHRGRICFSQIENRGHKATSSVLQKNALFFF